MPTRKGSTTRWRTAPAGNAVLPLDGITQAGKRSPRCQRLIVDAPPVPADEAGEVLEIADAVVVPIQPSALDIEASVRFSESLGKHPRVRKGKLRIGLVGNRLKPNTNASQQALEILRGWPVPLVAQLRDSQAYVVLTGLGKSLFDYHSAQVREHQADWVTLLHWLKKD
jgi:chromosome partitioning protein